MSEVVDVQVPDTDGGGCRFPARVATEIAAPENPAQWSGEDQCVLIGWYIRLQVLG
jgi:hypothetical protein